MTEVHHINGEGEDAGVVYCEMQGRENMAEELSTFLLLRHMYPGHCGYKSNTGGKMSNLRDSCSNEKVYWCVCACVCAHACVCVCVCVCVHACLYTVLCRFAPTIVGSIVQTTSVS